MKKKLLHFVLLLILISTAARVNAQSLVVRSKDGTETIRNLVVLQKLTFENNNLYLHFTGGSSEAFALTNVGKIFFKSGTTAADLISRDQSNGNISLYPNPVGDAFHLLNIPEGTSVVTVYRIDGAVILQTRVSPAENAIDVSNLNKGLYLLKIQNQAIKFIKL